ncbi:MAG: beta galactosidase jelly roll domain-containing protein [Ignavibacteriae bacterium]|nr:beta galactosidase jelly roll domain-containing protein [Ignavibacteriota bacterium]
MNVRLKIIGFALLIFIANNIFAEQKFTKIENLKGLWRFNLGDNKKWANPNYDDSDWDAIKVPSPWEDEGYNGYDGYAWYRKEFNIDSKYLKKKLYLSLGTIDDAAEVYLNGKLIASSGSFPPNFNTAYNSKIWLPLQNNFLNQKGINSIAIRVYDDRLEGGIYSGDIGIFTSDSPLNFIINLEGTWKFQTGDNSKWMKNNFDDKSWKKLIVPSNWDWQGYNNYDGFAWYRISFDVNLEKEIYKNDLILIIGKIDDIDETYLNEKMIGSTGDLLAMPLTRNFSEGINSEYSQLRGYKINKEDLRNGRNVIAIRVYDGFQYGGIYEGPIGITTLKDYLRYITRNLDSKKKNFIEMLFDE